MKIRTDKITFVSINTTLSLFLIIFYNSLNNTLLDTGRSTTIYFLSLLGLIISIYVFFTIKKMTNKLMTLYGAFMLLFILFNFGHCLLWAFNIHFKGEIGTTTLYTLQTATPLTIIKTQLATIISILGIHTGAVLFYKRDDNAKNTDNSRSRRRIIINDKLLLNSNLILCIISGIAMAIIIAQSISIAHTYGYRSLYYGDYVNNKNPIITHISKLFIPSLFGILIGSSYEKKYTRLVYTLFAIYTIGWLTCGDRGTYIYPLIVFVIFHNLFNKRIRIKNIIIYCILGLVSLTILNAIVSVRSKDLSIDSIASAVSFSNNPVKEEIIEMGNSMRTTATVIQYKDKIRYPYGNTYINAVLSMVSERITRIIKKNYENLSTWFSSDFLGINYGAGFSFIAEALLNYNIIILPILSIILGAIVSKSFLLTEKDKNNKIKIILSGIAFVCIAPICRGTLQDTLKTLFYTLIVYIIIMVALSKKNRGSNETQHNVHDRSY